MLAGGCSQASVKPLLREVQHQGGRGCGGADWSLTTTAIAVCWRCSAAASAAAEYDAKALSANGYVVSVSLDHLPGALVLLQESGCNQLVLDLGAQWLKDNRQDVRRRDVTAAMALAYHSLAVQSLQQEGGCVLEGCRHLESALSLLRQSIRSSEDAVAVADLQRDVLQLLKVNCVTPHLTPHLTAAHRSPARTAGVVGSRHAWCMASEQATLHIQLHIALWLRLWLQEYSPDYCLALLALPLDDSQRQHGHVLLRKLLHELPDDLSPLGPDKDDFMAAARPLMTAHEHVSAMGARCMKAVMNTVTVTEL